MKTGQNSKLKKQQRQQQQQQQQQEHNLFFSLKNKHFLEQLSTMYQQFWEAFTVAMTVNEKM